MFLILQIKYKIFRRRIQDKEVYFSCKYENSIVRIVLKI